VDGGGPKGRTGTGVLPETMPFRDRLAYVERGTVRRSEAYARAAPARNATPGLESAQREPYRRSPRLQAAHQRRAIRAGGVALPLRPALAPGVVQAPERGDAGAELDP
jgi:hypothetical protein